MRKDPTGDQRLQTQLTETAFPSVLEEFHVFLRGRGYAESTVSTYAQAASHFFLWATEKNVPPSGIASQQVHDFLEGHLPECRCPIGGTRTRHTIRASLRQLLAALDVDRDQDSEVDLDDIDREVIRFDDYLSATCGLRKTREFIDGAMLGSFSTRHSTLALSTFRG